MDPTTITTTTTHFPPVWRVLGLSVAIGYAGLGTSAILTPPMYANTFGLTAKDETSRRTIQDTAFLLGVRDLSIGAAIGVFYYRQEPKNMAIVILSAMILCVADVALVWKNRRDWSAAALGVGASIWAYIGVQLYQL